MGRTAIACALAAAPAGADDGARLTELLNDLTSFRADFEQVVLDRFGETLQATTGTLHWQRPHRLRWEVDAPYPQLILADGESLWVYDPDLEQVSVQPLAESLEGTPASFLAGTAEALASQFDVRAEASAEQSDARYLLTPHDEASVFRDLTLAFSPTGVLTLLDMADHLGAHTRTTFTKAAKNPSLEAALFAFKVPDGVDVIGELPPAGAAEDTPAP